MPFQITLYDIYCWIYLLLCCPWSFPSRSTVPPHLPTHWTRAELENEFRKRNEKDQKSRLKNEPIPLPKNRRKLSIVLKPEDGKNLILRLPLELREEIYKQVLGGRLFHIVRRKKRLGHVCCNISNAQSSWFDTHRQCFPQMGVQLVHEYTMVLPNTSNNELYLLRTCRQIYMEASRILYSANAFEVNEAQCLIFLHNTITPRLFGSIQTLQVCWNGWIIPYHHIFDPNEDALLKPNDRHTWEIMWSIVGKMTDLRELRLSLCMRGRLDPPVPPTFYPPTAIELESMLLPLQQNVRGLTKFHLWSGIPEFTVLEEFTRSIVCS